MRGSGRSVKFRMPYAIHREAMLMPRRCFKSGLVGKLKDTEDDLMRPYVLYANRVLGSRAGGTRDHAQLPMHVMASQKQQNWYMFAYERRVRSVE